MANRVAARRRVLAQIARDNGLAKKFDEPGDVFLVAGGNMAFLFQAISSSEK
ncbi:hypothetical protein D3C80_2228390 [compost metagenome]